MLTPFLHENLNYLSFSYCPQIGNNDLILIQQRCHRLKELHLISCSGLTAIQDQTLQVFSSRLSFSNLKQLRLDNCVNLHTIRIQSPCFEGICVRKIPNLRQLDIASWITVNTDIDAHLIQQANNFEWSPKDMKPLSEDLRNNREFILKAVSKNGHALKFANDDFRGDREIVMPAVRQNGLALEYADKTLQNRSDVVVEAI